MRGEGEGGGWEGEGKERNQMEFHLVQNRKENCHHDRIPLNVKGKGKIVSSVNIKYNIDKGRGTGKERGTHKWRRTGLIKGRDL